MNAAVFDTNVLISGVLSPHGSTSRLVDALRDGWVRAVIDDRIWDEYEDVFHRSSFGFVVSDVDVFLGKIRTCALMATHVSEWPQIRELPDADDAPFLECAHAMNVPLVTGNLNHFPASLTGNVEIITPANYLRRLTPKT